VLKRSQAEQTSVKVEFADESGFGYGLLRGPTNAGDSNCCSGFGSFLALAAAKFLLRQFEHRFEQADFRFTDRKLRSVDADRQTARAGGNVVAEKRALPAFIELAPRI